MIRPSSPLTMLLSRHTRRHEFISLFGGMAAAWSLAAHAQESATMQATEATTATLPQIEMARVKPVDRLPPDLRLSDKPIDLMKDFRLSNAEYQVRAAWPRLRGGCNSGSRRRRAAPPPTPFADTLHLLRRPTPRCMRTASKACQISANYSAPN
jgi:hypothetical protein